MIQEPLQGFITIFVLSRLLDIDVNVCLVHGSFIIYIAE